MIVYRLFCFSCFIVVFRWDWYLHSDLMFSFYFLLLCFYGFGLVVVWLVGCLWIFIILWFGCVCLISVYVYVKLYLVSLLILFWNLLFTGKWGVAWFNVVLMWLICIVCFNFGLVGLNFVCWFGWLELCYLCFAFACVYCWLRCLRNCLFWLWDLGLHVLLLYDWMFYFEVLLVDVFDLFGLYYFRMNIIRWLCVRYSDLGLWVWALRYLFVVLVVHCFILYGMCV